MRMVSVTHGHNLQILTAEHGSFPWFSWVSPAEWRNGGMAEWQNGGMAEWRNGGMAGMAGMAQWREWSNGGNGGTAEWQKRDGRRMEWLDGGGYCIKN